VEGLLDASLAERARQTGTPCPRPDTRARAPAGSPTAC